MTETLKFSSRMVGDVVILDLSGPITLLTTFGAQRDFASLVAEGKRKILLNIAGVNYVDSAGLGFLVGAHVRLRKQGGILKLLSPTERVCQALKCGRLYSTFDVFAEESKALASFSGPELRCCCPLCGAASGPPVPDGEWSFCPSEVCRNAECEAEFTVASSRDKGQALVKSVRIQTYMFEYVELLSGPPFTIKIVGRLNLFSSPALKRVWQGLPVPRRVIFDMCGTTEIDEAGREALLDLLAKREKDARAVVSLEGLRSEQVSQFPTEPPFYQSKAAALAALGDVSKSPPLLVQILKEDAKEAV